jgi:ferredoxin-NADP reductase
MHQASATYKTVVITAIREEMPGVKTFTLAYEDGGAIPYAAGQFITLVFTHHSREERRSFSISASPALHEPLSFTVKRIDNGAYSRLLTDRALVGDKLYTTEAAGLFTIPPADLAYEQLFFFAAGIGITPVISLIKTLLHTQPKKKIVLIYSNRSMGETVFYEELRTLKTQFADTFKVEFLYSTSYNLARARLNKSLLPLLLEEYAAAPRHKLLFYICGPFQYMRMAILTLEELGIHGSQVKKENFNTNDRQVKQTAPPDKATHLATIKFKGSVHTFPVVYPESLLQAAKKHGIVLPYSCEVGRCGSCAARCTKGEVWLSYNEVLMDTDLKHGSILTCTGHPVNGDVVIEV